MSSKLRKEVALGGHVLDHAGLSDYVWGHVSVRDSKGRGVWMKPKGLAFDEVRASDVLLVSWEGEVLEGDRERHGEYPIHTEAMLESPAINSVVHCHPAHAMAMVAAGVAIQPFSHIASVFSHPVPVYFDAPGLVLTAEQGKALARARGASRAILMHGHGVVTVGASVGAAVTTAVMLERACYLQLLAAGYGGVKRPFTEEQALSAYHHTQGDGFILEAWAYLARSTTAARSARPR
jgi:ribulose-5-phosphate 4-epimerase/fuculose-1-phosphate aldolase